MAQREAALQKQENAVRQRDASVTERETSLSVREAALPSREVGCKCCCAMPLVICLVPSVGSEPVPRHQKAAWLEWRRRGLKRYKEVSSSSSMHCDSSSNMLHSNARSCRRPLTTLPPRAQPAACSMHDVLSLLPRSKPLATQCEKDQCIASSGKRTGDRGESGRAASRGG